MHKGKGMQGGAPGKVSILESMAIVALLLASSATWAACDDDWLGIDEVREGGNIELRATNLRQFPITFTLRVKPRGLVADGPATVTETLEAEQSRSVVMLKENDDNKQRRYRLSCDWTVGVKDATHDDDVLYHLPYAIDKSYPVIQGYGSRFSHTGLEYYAVDFYMAVGTPVHAARTGVVAKIEESHNKGCWEDGCGKFANYIVVLHSDGTTGEYYHLQQNGALVDVGDRVEAGQKIALSGNTGHTTMPHLHFAVYRAVEWGNTQSIPVRFMSTSGVVDHIRRGGRYQAIASQTSTQTSSRL